MKVEVVKIKETDEMLKKTLEQCWNVDMKVSKKRLYACSDSILEIPEYYIYATVPRSVAMQMETHKKKHGTYLWLSSARPDLSTADTSEYSRTQPVRFVMKTTARGLVDISHYRMCGKAEAPTRKFMKLLQEKIREIEPELADNMMPMCYYRNGVCTELRCCGLNKTYKENM
jgi:hypothetical protein